jgi:hypothetical protein
MFFPASRLFSVETRFCAKLAEFPSTYTGIGQNMSAPDSKEDEKMKRLGGG